MIDPYAILGVSKSSSLEDIKKAYKKKARAYHPDLNPGNKEAENKFKSVTHAFDLIGTREAKEKFDSGETDEQKQHMYEEYIKKQGERKQRPFYHETQGQSARYSSSFGEGFDDDIFSQIFGRRGKTQGLDLPGEDAHYHLEIDFLEAAKGTEKRITLPNGKNLMVKIPAGINTGQKLKFARQGGPGIGNGPSGDAFVEITVRPHELFKREGRDILSELPVSFFEAINGGEVNVQTVDGDVLLVIPPGVSTGTKLRIKDKGAGAADRRGNHIVILKVVMPKSPPEDLKQALKELEKRFSYTPRGQV